MKVENESTTMDEKTQNSFGLFDSLRTCTQVCFGKKLKFEEQGITVSITSKAIGKSIIYISHSYNHDS